MIGTAVAFLLSPIGRLIGIGALALAVAGGIWKSGYNYASRACEAAALRAELAAAQQDLNAEREAAARAKAAIDDLSKQKESDDAAISQLQVELSKRPVAAQCRLDGDDARRLR
jgi:cobalamin biosynthesis protein CbiD